MPVKMQPTSVIKARLGIEPNGRVQKFFTATCARHMDKYVPYDTGTLADTVKVENDKVIYRQQYARYVYDGVAPSGKPLNYHRDKHPLANDHWDKRMWSAERADVVREVQNYVNRGGK